MNWVLTLLSLLATRMTYVNQTFSGAGYEEKVPQRSTAMRASRNLRCSASLSVLSLLVSVPGLGQSLHTPCSAFARNADGGWKVLAPVMLEIDGRLLGPIVGTTFEPGSIANGIKMSDVLDRACR